ncbi:efflux RND transporter periplasmic adaptor subunit [Paenibacillus donghaensis]|uniref:efflux RND transporter periplasmic adaptor subunit n=1 Tax=Paenibacillus donghaensis TaxID=414771 RepID=UPI001883CC6F|nr:efflux RND transporter periplasmic adaptor subunit [Paenibacillus donghaensis]MBE9918316.1 efflux RND transporter periplasmic adaptor subunit [Paenibacillus donghaensis]
MKTRLLLFVIIICFVGLTVYFFREPKSASPVKPLTSNDMTVQVTREDLVKTIEVKGKATYGKKRVLSAPFGGAVSHWNIRQGAMVKAGDILFQIDTSALKDEISQLRMAAEKQSMELRLAEFQDASEEASTEPDVWDEEAGKKRTAAAAQKQLQQKQSEEQLRELHAKIAEKEKLLAQSAYAAPESGIVLLDNDGTVPTALTDKERIGVLVNPDDLKLSVFVGEKDYVAIKPGMPVRVKVNAYKDMAVDGKVEAVANYPKASSQGTGDGKEASLFEITIALDKVERLVAGFGLAAEIELSRKEAVLAIPTYFVQHKNGKTYATLQTAEGTVQREITVGAEVDEKVEVLSGLQEGDTIVLEQPS